MEYWRNYFQSQRPELHHFEPSPLGGLRSWLLPGRTGTASLTLRKKTTKLITSAAFAGTELKFLATAGDRVPAPFLGAVFTSMGSGASGASRPGSEERRCACISAEAPYRLIMKKKLRSF